MGALDTISDYYNKNDPRTSEWLLVSSPKTLIVILLCYTYFCVSLGPKFMKNKQPYTLRKTLLVYNFIQVLLSIYMAHEGLMAGWLFEYSFTCQPVDYSDSPSALRMARVVHLYFVCKVVELLDTIFFVLRKKERQISFLHLYHHGLMPLFSWYIIRYVPGGHPTLAGILNSFVHIFMYAYYMLAALGPELQKFLWWKKYLTILQILQFAIVSVHSAQVLLTDCNIPKFTSQLILSQAIVFFYMFVSFYYESHAKSNVQMVDCDRASTNSLANGKSD